MTWTKLQADDYPPGIPFVSGAATELENIQVGLIFLLIG